MSSSLPFVSIVIPAKNEAKHIKVCLESLYSQTYPKQSFEIIIVDNNSTDSTPSIVDNFKYKGNITLYAHDGNTIASVRNFGAHRAKGKIIAFLDGDCQATPDWLRTGIEMLISETQAVCIGFVSAEPADGSTWVQKAWHNISSTSRFEGTKPVTWLSSFNLIMWREVFDKLGGFNERLITCEDADLGYRIGTVGTLLASDKVKIRHLGESKTLKDFFFKEFWRGTSNLRSFKEGLDKKRDFLSVLIPPFYVFSSLTIIIITVLAFSLGLSWRIWSLLLAAIFLVGPPMILAFWKARKLQGVKSTLNILVLSAVYLTARGSANLRYRT